MISQNTIEKVHELSIVDVISSYIELQKKGSTYSALSPFSQEKTPSFFVVPAKNIFKCFSSGKGGNAVKFVMEKENLTFPEAIKSICDKLGFEVEYDNSPSLRDDHQKTELQFAINEEAATLYASEFTKLDSNHGACKEIFDLRKYTRDTVLQWGIGYAPGQTATYNPRQWQLLTGNLKKQEREKEGIELGLLKTKDSVVFDMFRNRIIFPITNHLGRCVGFGGRSLQVDQYNPKYINSSESKIFSKSSILYGLEIPRKLTTSFRDKLTTKSYFTI